MLKIKDPRVKLNTKTVIALGCFDGVHLGHAKVIGEAVRIAHELGCKSAAWCFSEPPKNAYLRKPVPLICDAREKEALIRRLGVDILIEPDFTREISQVSAHDFVRELLCDCSGAVHLVCGRNYSFGAGGGGNVELLGDICHSLSLGLSIVEDVSVDGVNVSSTLVREAVLSGQCVYAQKLLGRSFALCLEHAPDTDILGEENTTLLFDKKYLFPCDGEYEVEVCCGGARRRCVAYAESFDGKSTLSLDRHIPEEGRLRVELCSNRSRRRH